MSTDNYLKILSQVKASQIATPPVVEEFAYFVSSAFNALDLLGLSEEHNNYMERVIEDFYTYIPKEKEDYLNFKSFKENIDDYDEIVESLTWEDIYDLYDEDELIYEHTLESLDEKISAQSRMRKSMSMKRNSPRVSIARNLKLKRTSSMEVLKKRAVNAARRSMYKKLLMGRNKAQLSASEKDMLEKRLKSLKYMQSAIAIKMLPKLKSIEQSRLAHRTKRK